MQPHGVQALGRGVEVSRDDVRGEDVGGVGVRVAEEVGEGDGGEGVLVGVGGGVEFYHGGGAWGGMGWRSRWGLLFVGACEREGGMIASWGELGWFDGLS